MQAIKIAVLLSVFVWGNTATAEDIAWEVKKFAPVSVAELHEKYGIDLPKMVPLENLSEEDRRLSEETRTNKYSISPFDLNGDGVEELFIFTYRMDKCGAYNCPILFYAKNGVDKYVLLQEFTGADGIRFAQGKGQFGPISFPRPLAFMEDGKEWYEWRWDGAQYKEIP